MKADFRKAVVVAAAAGILAAGSLAASPASAGGYYGHGWGHHGGWGHGGWGHRGWGHGGWGHRGWGWGHPGWRRHGWGHGGWGAPVAAGLLGGLAVGAAFNASPGYYGYGRCYVANQPITDAWGNIVAYDRVRVCN